MAEAFPNRQWGSRTTAVSRAANRFAATRAGSWLVRRVTPLDRAVLERTGGRYTILGPIGAPVVALTTIGRKSGQPRTQPLLYVHDGDTLYVVGSNFGRTHHPAWTSNLLANPAATVAIAGERIPVIATPVPEADAGAIFARFVELTGAYSAYRERTDRELRIFALTRA
ncbi:nitroreductase family deazaflavin-dependent oxidoreductase [Nocardia arizonensis]|uniref:nitroreductase family deazaflavin-dependent oxidoreductase n=1 Tax=Nocardia arizonensis TaxID=1141647 RepID=UPI0006D277AD|nr:nitroreductase family deazaflavin-dependent oxidoreductase [Nocardia arizonensis]